MIRLQYMPFSEIGHLETDERLKKILKSVKEDKIILIDGKLEPYEETELIRRTMEMIDKQFKGIEIASIDYKKRNEDLFDKFKIVVANLILGKNSGFTIVGPATIVKEIKKDPYKIELFTFENSRKKR